MTSSPFASRRAFKVSASTTGRLAWAFGQRSLRAGLSYFVPSDGHDLRRLWRSLLAALPRCARRPVPPHSGAQRGPADSCALDGESPRRGRSGPRKRQSGHAMQNHRAERAQWLVHGEHLESGAILGGEEPSPTSEPPGVEGVRERAHRGLSWPTSPRLRMAFKPSMTRPAWAHVATRSRLIFERSHSRTPRLAPLDLARESGDEHTLRTRR